MTTAVRTAPPTKVPMTSTRKTALVAGIFYLITFISIPTLALYGNLKTDRSFVLGSGSDSGVLWGCILEVIVAIAGIGTAVTLFPVVKRQNEGFALGFVASRTLEATMIFTGVTSLVSLVHLRHDLGTAAGGDAGALVTNGASLVSTYNSTFQLGQTLMPSINAVLLGYLMYRSGLVPRIIPTLGLIGAPFLMSATLATTLGHNQPLSAWSALATLPVAAWEFSLGVWLTFKGFKPTPITAAIDA
jgi:hypothetical protein